MRRFKDVLVQPGCDLDKALEAGDHALAERIYADCEKQYRRHFPAADNDPTHIQSNAAQEPDPDRASIAVVADR